MDVCLDGFWDGDQIRRRGAGRHGSRDVRSERGGHSSMVEKKGVRGASEVPVRDGMAKRNA